MVAPGRRALAWRSCHFSYRRRSYSRSVLVDKHTLLRRRAVQLVVRQPHCMEGTGDSLGKPWRRATSSTTCDITVRTRRSATVPPMQVVTVVSAVFGARCSVLVHDDGSCVVVDAGAGVADDVLAVVAERQLRPAAVLATHGHVDHTWDAARLSEALDVPVILHAADVYRLSDPFGTLGLLGSAAHDPPGPLAQAIAATGIDPGSYVAPQRVEPFGRSTTSARPTRSSSSAACASSPGTHPGTPRGRRCTWWGRWPSRGTSCSRARSVGPTSPAATPPRCSEPCGKSSRPCRRRPSSSPGTVPTSDIATELVHNPYLARDSDPPLLCERHRPTMPA